MDKSKIYIASSKRALLLAEKLCEKLQEPYCEADLWSNVIKKNPGKPNIEILEEAIKSYDFAVILLVQDDVTGWGTDDMLKVRDDCIFEAGLFMASLGRGRCFLLSGAPKNDLPADLGGIDPLFFQEPDDLTDRSLCDLAMERVCGRIKDKVQPVGPIAKGTTSLTKQALLERERHTIYGGELLEDQVVVSSELPLETEYQAARWIRKNIDNNIKYVYFFEGSYDGAEKTCMLLQLVLVANILGDRQEEVSFQDRRAHVTANPEKIVQNLEWICRHDFINVYFLPAAPDLQYCIHNASEPGRARMYVKHRGEFIEWESGSNASEFWSRTQQKRGVGKYRPKDAPKHAVFYGAPGFNLGDFGVLEELVEKYFPGVEKAVLGLCLNGTEFSQTQYEPAGAHGSATQLSKVGPFSAPGPSKGGEDSSGAQTVFISYNHGDGEIADKLKATLEKNGIVVRIDEAVMEAGANIQEFIESSIRATDVTLSIISNRSLLSAWVALESIDTFYQEKFTGNKKFIACYIDDDFFQTDFRLKATKQIDIKIDEIERLIPEYIARKIDTNDLNDQKSRLYELRHNLGSILQRLRGSLCVDIREDKFEEGVAKIVNTIKGKS
jgi:hypothetical protein